jgi:hypothetical protein
MVKNQFKENEMSETRKRAKYTLEFKMEAVRLVKGGQAVSVTAKVLGIPKASWTTGSSSVPKANSKARGISLSVRSKWSWPALERNWPA